MAIKNFDKEQANSLRTTIQQALDEVSKKYGIAIRVGNCSYSDKNMSYKLEVSTLGEDGKAELKEASAFLQYAELLNMKSEDLGREFSVGAKKFKFRGYAARKIKLPMVCEELSTGELKLLPEKTVKKALGYEENQK